jgi:hypothetical protein
LLVGIHSPSFEGVGLRCTPRDTILGICTSSRSIGPSISFGEVDSATVVSEDVLLADACATRLGNIVTGKEDHLMRGGIEEIVSIHGVEGALLVVGGKVALKGQLPELVRIGDSDDRIARHLMRGP